MPDKQDMELVREFARHNSEAAFAELVRRHINLVYSVALRCTGNSGDAEDVTQAVFIILARKAAGLRENTLLAGWLYETTRFTAARVLRTHTRRQHREQEAYVQSTLNETGFSQRSDAEADVWQRLSPHLEAAMSKLGESDRALLVLRFYENKSGPEAAALLGIREGTAHKRAARAIEKLRKFFAKQGVSSTSAIIAGVISAHSVHTAPAALAKSVTAAAIAKGTAASGSILTLVKGALKVMAWTKAKMAVVAGIAVILAAGSTTLVVKEIVSSKREMTYEVIFQHPDGSSLRKLEQTPPVLIVRLTHYPDKDGGIWTPSDKGVYVNASLTDLVAWAYNFDPTREILPDDAPKGHYDYLNTMRNPENVLREEIKRQFGLVARHEVRPTDVLLLTASDPAKLNSFRTKGGSFAAYGQGSGNTQVRYFTNAPLSLLASQIVEGYFKKPCVGGTDLKAKYDFTIQWEEPKGLSGQARLEALQPVMKEKLQQLGLELVPTNMPIEMLVVEKGNY